ncbi:MAG: SDR family oxidoreductase [Chloroflexota bacterium]
MGSSERPVALVTGGTRGVGAATARRLAARGYDVALTYRNKAKRAAEVAAGVEQHGVGALSVGCDITRQEDVDQLMATLRAWAGRLDVLVLNASGGLERDLLAADPQYPTRINRDAQLAVLDGALPLMGSGAAVVFVTSHWAHRYGQVEQLPAYTPVAASKHAGERALRARQPDLHERGVRLIVVTGDLIEGTITPRLLERRSRGTLDQWRGAAGALPTTEVMGEAIARAVTDPALPGGHTVVVGRPLESLPGIGPAGRPQ